MPQAIRGFDSKAYLFEERRLNGLKKTNPEKYLNDIGKLIKEFRANTSWESDGTTVKYQYLFDYHMNSIVDVLTAYEKKFLISLDKYDKLLDKSEVRWPGLPPIKSSKLVSIPSQSTIASNATGISNSDSDDFDHSIQRGNNNWFGGKRRTRKIRRRKNIKKRN